MSGNLDPELLERMVKEARLGRLSRRDFMRYATAAGVAGAVATGA